MLRLVKKNDKPLKFRVWNNDSYLVEYDLNETHEIEEIANVVKQGFCTGCNFRPGDRNCSMMLRGISGESCFIGQDSPNAEATRVYMRDEQILDYEVKHDVLLISPSMPQVVMIQPPDMREGEGSDDVTQ